MAAKKLGINEIVSGLEDLPTLPTIVYELSQVINDPMSSTNEVEKLMSNDQSLTTKVLKLVNSAYYAIPGGVSGLSRAIAYLGYDTVSQLVLTASIIKALEVKGPSKFDLNEFWKHSLGTAIAAETIGNFVRHPLPSDLFTCGLVHDMGKVALYTIDSEVMLSIVNHAQKNNMSYLEAELDLEMPTHTTIGSLLAEKWTLPGQMQAAIKYHHQPNPSARGGAPAEVSQIVDIIYISNLFIQALKFGSSGHSKIMNAEKEVLLRLTIDPDKDFKKLLLNIKKALDGAEEFLRILGD